MKRDVDYYLSIGMDKVTAEYFASGIKDIVSVKPNLDFTLTLEYDNGQVRIFDCKHLLGEGTVFEPFIDYENFKRVYVSDNGRRVCWDIDPEVDSNEVWNNVVDLCADALYIESVPLEDLKAEYDFSKAIKNPYNEKLEK